MTKISGYLRKYGIKKYWWGQSQTFLTQRKQKAGTSKGIITFKYDARKKPQVCWKPQNTK